jgi:hypothetical protein
MSDGIVAALKAKLDASGCVEDTLLVAAELCVPHTDVVGVVNSLKAKGCGAARAGRAAASTRACAAGSSARPVPSAARLSARPVPSALRAQVHLYIIALYRCCR